MLRRLDAPLTLGLDRLHLAIQAAMGWENCHLHEFRAGEAAWGEPDPEGPGEGPADEAQASLADLIEAAGGKAFAYLYDFGDDWAHAVVVEGLTDPAPEGVYPALVEAVGRCPPEDCGGPWGYAELLEAVADPGHERHEEMIERVGEGYDPAAVDVNGLAETVRALAERWSRPSGRRDS